MIDNEKQLLRGNLKLVRKNIPKDKRLELDKEILKNIICCPLFENADTILTYVSTAAEVDTTELINYSLLKGKKIAVPKTFPNGIMEFYYINSLNNLIASNYAGILEPIHNQETLVKEVNNDMICIVPALSFDTDGYRLGYGGGYYDRYIAKNSRATYLGVCYQQMLSKQLLPRNEFDRKVKYIITENKIMEVQDG